MTIRPKVLVLAGSTRKDSYNKKLAKAAMVGAVHAGAEATFIDLADYPLPLFDEDLEKQVGIHENEKKLKDLFKSHHALLISSPEYNSSISAVLKNAIDWISRPTGDSRPLEAFAGKVAGLMSASPGALGGLRGLVHLRSILGNIQVLVIPDQFALVKAHEAFDDQGRLKDEKQRASVEAIGQKVAATAARLHG